MRKKDASSGTHQITTKETCLHKSLVQILIIVFVTTDEQTNPYENETIHVYERRRNQERLEQIQGLDVATVSSCELDAYFSAIYKWYGCCGVHVRSLDVE